MARLGRSEPIPALILRRATVEAAGPVTYEGAVDLVSASTLTATSELIQNASASLTATSTLGAIRYAQIQGSVALTAASTLTATGTQTTPALPVSTLPADFTNPVWLPVEVDGIISATSTTLTMTGDPDWNSGLKTDYDYTLDESRVFLQVTQWPTGGYLQIELYDEADSWFYWRVVSDGQLLADIYGVGNTLATWDPAKSFLSIRESGGTIYLERSATGQPGTWETVYSHTYGGALDPLTFAAYVNYGSTGTAVVRNLNTAASISTGAANLSSTSTLTATALVTKLPTAALVASSTLTLGLVATRPGSVPLVATSTLTATAIYRAWAHIDLEATSTLGTVGERAAVGSVALVATSTLSATGTTVGEVAASANLVAVSTLTAPGFAKKFGGPTLTAVSTLTSTASIVRELAGAVGLVASSTLTATAGILGAVPASAALVASSTLSTTGLKTQIATVTLSATATLVATGWRTMKATAALIISATLTIDTGPPAKRIPNAAHTGVLYSLDASEWSYVLNVDVAPLAAEAHLVATATLVATGRIGVKHQGVVALHATSTLSAVATISGAIIQGPTISLATLVSPTDIAACTTLNQNLDSTPSLMDPYTYWLDRVHSENHTTSGIYNIWAGAKNKGTSATSLGQKMTAAGLKTSVYGHGSYIMQARPEESPDIEANYPLSIAVFNPGWPDDERLPEMLTVDPAVNRDEVGFEATTSNYWGARGPVGVTSQLVTAGTATIGTAPRSGTQCLAVIMGSTPGQMTAGTGVGTGIAKACFQGMKVETGVYCKPGATLRPVGAEIRWMDAAYATVSTTTGPVVTETAGTWTERTVTGEAPAGAVWWALIVRWTGPPANGEVHYLDDAHSTDFAGRLVSALDSSQTSITVRSAQRLKPSDSIASVDITANTMTHNAHGLIANTQIYMVGSNLPAPLVDGTVYYVANPTTNTFQVSSVGGGAAIDLTTTGAQSKYSIAPNRWPFRTQRGTDVTVTTTATSVSTAQCVHWVRIDDEIMGITGVTGPTAGIVTILVVRGLWGTTATTHTADTTVFSPVYVGSISEGADATFAGSPQVNDAAKALRYSIALEQGLEQTQTKRATEWITKRRIMELLEYDWSSNPNNVPETSSPATTPPTGWSGYTSAGTHNKSVNSMYLDITGTSFYNMADSWGYDATPWTLVGVPTATPPVAADALMTQAALAEAQIQKVNDFRTYMTTAGISGPHVLIGNNLAWQSNVQDPEKQKVIDSGVLDYANLEFWINNPTLTVKYTAQRDQWMLICKNNLKAAVWAKTGQSGVANTPFDSPPTGTVSAADISHYRRWCYAHFLMGWRGSANQQFITEWGLSFLAAMEPEFKYNLGNPIGTYDVWAGLPTHATGVVYRNYSSGQVILNTTGSGVTVPVSSMKDLSTPGLDTITSRDIGAYDAAFLHTP